MGWYTSIPSNDMLDSWINNRYNVCLHGRHGVGKTSLVFEAFERKGWKLNEDYLYFSAATIDPWVDLIGVPARVKNAEGEEVLQLIRPANIKGAKIKAFFVDEFNRSHKKVRNAMMELIQFKSINGMKFPNLEVVWTAVNPDEDSDLKFDVEKLDPAQEDRFQIHVQIPYKPSQAYFAEKFGDAEMAEAVCKWWQDQPLPAKLQVTPRRLEYAIDVFRKTNDLRFVVPNEAHVPSLKSAIESGNPEKMLHRLIAEGNESETRKWLAIENNLNGVQNLICSNKNIAEKVLHLLSDERLIAFASKHKAVIDQFKAEPKRFSRVIKDLAENSSQKILKDTCVRLLPMLDIDNKSLSSLKVEKKLESELKLSKRAKAKIFANYTLQPKCSPEKNNKVEKLPEILITLATECSFATNTHQRTIIMKKLGEVVSSSMNKAESNACLKIVEYIVSYSSEQGLEVILKEYRPVINSVLLSWQKHNETSTKSLYEVAPYLVVLGLVKFAENPSSFGVTEESLIFTKTGNDDCSSVPDEIEKPMNQSVDDLF